MLVVQGVVHHTPGATPLDPPEAAQYPQMLGNGGLGYPHYASQVADAEIYGGQGKEDLHAGGVGQRREGLRQGCQGAIGDQGRPGGAHRFRVDALLLA